LQINPQQPEQVTKMTRKDFELIARAIATLRSVYPDGAPVNDHDKGFEHGTKQAAQYIASALASDNNRFDRERFLRACGVAG